MNIKRALEVIDNIAKNRNSFGNMNEANMRVKLSDLRAVIEALGSEPQSEWFDKGCPVGGNHKPHKIEHKFDKKNPSTGQNMCECGMCEQPSENKDDDSRILKIMKATMEGYGMPKSLENDFIPAMDILQLIKDAGYRKARVSDG